MPVRTSSLSAPLPTYSARTTASPTSGAPVTGQEGTYLLVSKNLIELVAVAVILVCHTERIAGLDLLFGNRTPGPPESL